MSVGKQITGGFTSAAKTQSCVILAVEMISDEAFIHTVMCCYNKRLSLIHELEKHSSGQISGRNRGTNRGLLLYLNTT